MPASARLIACDPVARRLVRRRAHPRLVELHHIDAGGLEVAQLGVDRVGVVHRQLGLVLVELVLHLLRHRERAGQGDLGRAGRVLDEERRVVDLDLALAADFAGDPRDRGRAAVGADHRAQALGIDALQRQREIVRIAFAPHLAVADDVDADPFQLADREDGRVVLRLLQVRRRDAPDLVRMDARHPMLFQRAAVDQPVGLRIAADDGGGDQMGRVGHRLWCLHRRHSPDSIPVSTCPAIPPSTVSTCICWKSAGACLPSGPAVESRPPAPLFSLLLQGKYSGRRVGIAARCRRGRQFAITRMLAFVKNKERTIYDLDPDHRSQ